MLLAIATGPTACRFGEHQAAPPIDGAIAHADAPVADLDGAPDGENTFHGLRAAIGARPEWTGTCKTLPDYATMASKFDPSTRTDDVVAGWEFDTDADAYTDPSYGFDPAWPAPAAAAERFSVRFRGMIELDAGTHCFSIDTGATGTDIISGKNECGQVWVGAGGATPAKLAETGYEAATSGPATGCVDVASAGGAELDIVFWYFNVFERAKLVVRHCAGAACTPDQPLSVPALVPL